MAFDYNKLAKVMQLTQSSSDGEALAAIRMANAMLAKVNLNWAELIKNDFEVPEDNLIALRAGEHDRTFPPVYEQARQSDIEEIFACLLIADIEPDFMAVLQSIFSQYNRKRKISLKQYNVICKAYIRQNGQGLIDDLGI